MASKRNEDVGGWPMEIVSEEMDDEDYEDVGGWPMGAEEVEEEVDIVNVENGEGVNEVSDGAEEVDTGMAGETANVCPKAKRSACENVSGSEAGFRIGKRPRASEKYKATGCYEIIWHKSLCRRQYKVINLCC